MSERAYLLARIEKGLPSALRNMPKDQLVSSPYVRGRLIAHERGQAAGYLTSRNQASAQKISDKYARTARKRDRVRNPGGAFMDMVNSHYDKQHLLAAQSRTAGVLSQGRRAREASRLQLAKTPVRGRLVQTRRQYAQAA